MCICLVFSAFIYTGSSYSIFSSIHRESSRLAGKAYFSLLQIIKASVQERVGFIPGGGRSLDRDEFFVEGESEKVSIVLNNRTSGCVYAYY